MTAITIVDESTAGGKRTWTLDLLDETITPRELIRRRIYQEVAEYNAKQMGVFQGLVQPTEGERELNGSRLRSPRRLDWEAQYDRAVEAFGRRAYLVLVDDRQVTELDAQVELHAGSEVTFLKLVPLVGDREGDEQPDDDDTRSASPEPDPRLRHRSGATSLAVHEGGGVGRHASDPRR